MSNIRTASLEEVRAMKARGEITSALPSAKAVEMPDGFWDGAKLAIPAKKKPVSLRVDQDIIEFFKSQGSGHLTRMHTVLRAYVDVQRVEHRAG